MLDRLRKEVASRKELDISVRAFILPALGLLAVGILALIDPQQTTNPAAAQTAEAQFQVCSRFEGTSGGQQFVDFVRNQFITTILAAFVVLGVLSGFLYMGSKVFKSLPIDSPSMLSEDDSSYLTGMVVAFFIPFFGYVIVGFAALIGYDVTCFVPLPDLGGGGGSGRGTGQPTGPTT